MLFHDSSFTMEQDRYIQDDIDWTFSEIVMSPLSIIDVIDKHIPQVHLYVRTMIGIDFSCT